VCGEGYNGTLCGSCVKFPATDPLTNQSYYPFRGRCKECPKVAWQAIVFGIVLFIPFALLAALTALGKAPEVPWQALAGVKQLVNFMQQLSLSLEVEIPWPTPLRDFVNSLRVFEFDVSLLSPECYAE